MNQRGIYFGSGSSYGWACLNPKSFKERLEFAIERFPHSVPKMPDAIAFSGSSGAAFAFPLAMRYSLPLIMVRKPHEISHGYHVECNTSEPIKNFMIVDDFTCTGRTIRYILSCVARRAREMGNRPPPCLGVYQWSDDAREEERRFGTQTLSLYLPRSEYDKKLEEMYSNRQIMKVELENEIDFSGYPYKTEA